jgi:uncharacterized protein (TIGR00297 family)
MEPYGTKALATAAAVSALLAVRAAKKKSLTAAGAATGFVAGFALTATGLRGLVLFCFYQLGSWSTKRGSAAKAARDATLAASSQRGAPQVLCVTAAAAVLATWHAVRHGAESAIDFDSHPAPSRLACGLVAHHAAGLADTWSSELGILSEQAPVLITRPWRRVPPGTNGGVTVAGMLWSLLGGAAIGLLTAAMDAVSGIEPLRVFRLTLYGAVMGWLGSACDSLVGATLQATYWDAEKKLIHHHADRPVTAKHIAGINLLNNEQVNFVSMVLAAWIGGWMLGPVLFSI